VYNVCKGGDKMVLKSKDDIRYIAAEQGYSIMGLSQKAGISRVQLSNVAVGANTTPATAKKIADALGKSVTDLFEVIDRG
jgi:Helix-turn-helix.